MDEQLPPMMDDGGGYCELCEQPLRPRHTKVFRHIDSERVIRICSFHEPKAWNPLVDKEFGPLIAARTGKEAKKKGEKAPKRFSDGGGAKVF